MAELHKLAVAVALTTPNDAGGCAHLEHDCNIASGWRVHLELLDATVAAYYRGFAALLAVVARAAATRSGRGTFSNDERQMLNHPHDAAVRWDAV